MTGWRMIQARWRNIAAADCRQVDIWISRWRTSLRLVTSAAAVACRMGAAILLIQIVGPIGGRAQNADAKEGAGYAISERGPHHRTWSRVTEQPVRDGKVIRQTNSYVELATGMHYWEDGRWNDSEEVIEPAPGGAEARRGPIKVRFAANLNTAGAVRLTAPDGKVFRSHPLALYYVDAKDGRYELIARLKDSTGVLTADNEIVYPDAFTGAKCDVRFRYGRAHFEQDLILRQALPAPEQFGMEARRVRVCVVTEFVEAPAPERARHDISRLPASEVNDGNLAETALVEETLDFGAIKAYQGGAFPLADDAALLVPEGAAPTGKTWETWDGRTGDVQLSTDGAGDCAWVPGVPRRGGRDE